MGSQWLYLTAYLQAGRIELSSNRAERSIKPFVISRKNFLFANTAGGAKASATIFSLIETAKEAGLDPYRYLVWVLREAPRRADTALVMVMPWGLHSQAFSLRLLTLTIEPPFPPKAASWTVPFGGNAIHVTRWALCCPPCDIVEKVALPLFGEAAADRKLKPFFDVAPAIEYPANFHRSINNDIKNRKITDLDAVIWMPPFAG